jgi:hypothetical protein
MSGHPIIAGRLYRFLLVPGARVTETPALARPSDESEVGEELMAMSRCILNEWGEVFRCGSVNLLTLKVESEENGATLKQLHKPSQLASGIP